MLDNVRLFIGFILFIGIAVNFFYQGIRTLMKLHKRSVAKDTIHTFECRACEEMYQLDGEEAQERIGIWSTKLEKSTPTGYTSAIRFECPVCHTKAFQNQVFDTDVTVMAGKIRAQFDDSSKEILMDFLIKGLAPTLIITPLLGILFP